MLNYQIEVASLSIIFKKCIKCIKREAIQNSEVLFFGSEFSGHLFSVAREQRNLRMLCFVLGKFWKESKMSIVYVGKGDSSPGRGGGG